MDQILEVIQTLLVPGLLVIGGFLGFVIWKTRKKTAAVMDKEHVVLSVEVPKLSEKGPVSAENMFAALHGILNDTDPLLQDYLSFEIESKSGSIKFFIWVPKHLKEFVEGQIYAQYPTAEIRPAEDYTVIDDEPAHFAGTEIKLQSESYLPIKLFEDFEVDPLAGITGVLSNVTPGEHVWLQILARPLPDSWHKKGLKYAESVRSGQKAGGLAGLMGEFKGAPTHVAREVVKAVTTPPGAEVKKKGGGGAGKVELSETQKLTLKGIEEKAQKLGYAVKIRVAVFGDTPQMAALKLQGVAAAFKQFNTTTSNGFVAGKTAVDDAAWISQYRSRAFLDKGDTLNTAELASVYHLPYESVQTPNIVWTQAKKGEPPANLPIEGSVPPDQISLFGQTNFRSGKTRFGIKRGDRFRHTYIIGKSGMGKSEMMKLLIISDLIHGRGVAVVDPHGDLVEEIMQYIPKERVKDVVYFNPADPDYAIGFNPLEAIDPDLKYHVASGFVSIFKKIFGFSWGPRLEHIMRYTVLALMEYPNSTMLGVVKMLTDKNFRKKVRKEITDPAVKNFWQNEFESYSEKFATEAVAPILNKVGQFVATPLIRTIVGQPQSTIDLDDIINNKKILLVNLSTGKLGEDNAALLGAMFVTKIQLAAMRRAHIDKDKREEFYFYVDEFQNFATDSFAIILSEARKYKLALTVANQFVAQMPDEVKEAIFGNVGTMITFRVGAEDAAFFEKEFAPTFEATDLVNLGVQNIYVKMSIDGQTNAPFSATTLITPKPIEDHSAEIIKRSRELYARPKAEVEEKIARWQGLLDAEAREEQERLQGAGELEKSVMGVDRGRFAKNPPKRMDGRTGQMTQERKLPQGHEVRPDQLPNHASSKPSLQGQKDQQPAKQRLNEQERKLDNQVRQQEVKQIREHGFTKIEAEGLVVEYDQNSKTKTATPAPNPVPVGTNGTLKPGESVKFRNEN